MSCARRAGASSRPTPPSTVPRTELIAAAAYLVAAGGALAEGRASVAVQIIDQGTVRTADPALARPATERDPVTGMRGRR